MDRKISDRILSARKALRQQTIKTILDEFDGELLGLNKERRQLKYEKMQKNAFQFYRGSAFLFYYDVMNMPLAYHTPDDKPTWLQCDLHFDNFGAFRNKQGQIVYDTNDFDEGYLGSYLYDVLRMAVSIGLYSESLDYDEYDQKKFITAFLENYYNQLKTFAENGDQPDTLSFNESNTKGPVLKLLKELPERETNEVLDAITTVDGDQRKFQDVKGLVHLSPDEREALEENWHEYIASIDPENKQKKEFYTIKDAVKKVGSGTGSIGLLRYYILIEGNGDNNQDDLVLEAKEARTPAATQFFPYDELFGDDELHHGKRVISAQKAMHYLQDPFLGYFSIDNHHFYVRENSPYVGELEPEQLTSHENMDTTVEIMGKVTAKAHARADELLLSHQSEEEIIKAIGDEYQGFLTQMITATVFYKNRVHEDFELFTQWFENEYKHDNF